MQKANQQNSLTAFPQKFWSPRNEPRDPVNENIGNGTGIGTLTPIQKMTKIVLTSQ